jgi:predicted RNA-binding protein associated with RNAse of E/G family
MVAVPRLQSLPVHERWLRGDVVALREIWDGRVWTAYPAVAVEDELDQQLLYIPAGADLKYAVDESGRELRIYADRWMLGDHRATRHFLSFCWPDRRHAVLAVWDAGWNFTGWYVNIETPLDRTATTYDYVDHCLDVLIPPDRSTWTWKDEDELEEAVALGIFSPADAEAFRAEGMAAIERIIGGEPPFDRDWSGWRPDPVWSIPALPPGWDRPPER